MNILIEILQFWYNVCFENLAQIATILSPIIAVYLAIRTSKSTAKETQKQIESLKKTTLIVLDSQISDLDVEINNAKNQEDRIINEMELIKEVPICGEMNWSHQRYELEYNKRKIKQQQLSDELNKTTDYSFGLAKKKRELLILRKQLS